MLPVSIPDEEKKLNQIFHTTETITSFDPASNNLLEVNKKTPNKDVVMVST